MAEEIISESKFSGPIKSWVDLFGAALTDMKAKEERKATRRRDEVVMLCRVFKSVAMLC